MTMKFTNCVYGLLVRAYHQLDGIFQREDLMPDRTYRLMRNGSKVEMERPYMNPRWRSIFTKRTGIPPPKIWTVKEEDVEEGTLPIYLIPDIIREAARYAYSAKDEDGKYKYSIKKLRGKRLSDYDLRKIASELNLELRATRVSDEEEQHIVDVYNNLMLNGERVTNDVLERLLHRNMGTIYRALHSAESEVNWKRKKEEAQLIEVIDINRAA